jgi:hypothetical protein
MPHEHSFCVLVALQLCDLKLRPVFFLVAVLTELLLPLMLVHLLLALFTSPRHEWNSFR